jgi:hypothetical protein
MNLTPNQKRDAHKALSYYLAVRQEYQKGKSALIQLTNASALLDLTLGRTLSPQYASA